MKRPHPPQFRHLARVDIAHPWVKRATQDDISFISKAQEWDELHQSMEAHPTYSPPNATYKIDWQTRYVEGGPANPEATLNEAATHASSYFILTTNTMANKIRGSFRVKMEAFWKHPRCHAKKIESKAKDGMQIAHILWDECHIGTFKMQVTALIEDAREGYRKDMSAFQTTEDALLDDLEALRQTKLDLVTRMITDNRAQRNGLVHKAKFGTPQYADLEKMASKLSDLIVLLDEQGFEPHHMKDFANKSMALGLNLSEQERVLIADTYSDWVVDIREPTLVGFTGTPGSGEMMTVINFTTANLWCERWSELSLRRLHNLPDFEAAKHRKSAHVAVIDITALTDFKRMLEKLSYNARANADLPLTSTEFKRLAKMTGKKPPGPTTMSTT